MVFNGSANGAYATFFVDTLATHSFVDSSFASEHGLVRKKANARIQLADGSSQHASTQIFPSESKTTKLQFLAIY